MYLRSLVSQYSSFEGMHPLLRQVPPILSFSIIATLSPRWVAAALATSSPDPLPITIRSISLPI
jgi:hypothetical protein